MVVEKVASQDARMTPVGPALANLQGLWQSCGARGSWMWG